MDAKPLLVYPIALFLACVAHSLWARPPRASRYLLGLLVLFFMLKGLLDAGRQPHDFPYDMHLRLIERDGKHLGIHLILFPLVRMAFAYLAVCCAEWLTSLSPRTRKRFWPMVSASITCYGILGIGLELVNYETQWWTWLQDLGGVRHYLHYYLTWIVWAAGVFEALYATFVPWKRIKRPWLLSIGILIGFYVVLIAISNTVPFLRNPLFLPFAVIMSLVGIRARGPVLIPLRRRPLRAAWG